MILGLAHNQSKSSKYLLQATHPSLNFLHFIPSPLVYCWCQFFHNSLSLPSPKLLYRRAPSAPGQRPWGLHPAPLRVVQTAYPRTRCFSRQGWIIPFRKNLWPQRWLFNKQMRKSALWELMPASELMTAARWISRSTSLCYFVTLRSWIVGSHGKCLTFWLSTKLFHTTCTISYFHHDEIIIAWWNPISLS